MNMTTAGIVYADDVKREVWWLYFGGRPRTMDKLLMLEASLLAEFDQVIAGLEAEGKDEAAERLRDARALMMASMDDHRAWVADPNREPRGGAA